MRSPLHGPFARPPSPFGPQTVRSSAARLLATWADSNGGLAFDFTDITASQAYGSGKIIDGATPANNWSTTSSLTPFDKLTFTRASSATRINSSGVIELVSSNVARIDYNPLTLAVRGLLVEESRANLFLNSLIDGSNLSTQSVSVSATPYTISFYGTGSITLSGASTGAINGAGAYPNRVTSTFTPSAGTLTCTVSGTVQYAQIEAGAFATSFIPTAGVTATRAADNPPLIATSAFNHSATANTIYFNGMPLATGGVTYIMTMHEGIGAEVVAIYRSGGPVAYMRDGGVDQAGFSAPGGSITANVSFKTAYAFAANDLAVVRDGGTIATDTSATLPTVTELVIGANRGGFNNFNGWIRQAMHVPQRLSNANLQLLTT